jgi:hypothetical protein
VAARRASGEEPGHGYEGSRPALAAPPRPPSTRICSTTTPTARRGRPARRERTGRTRRVRRRRVAARAALPPGRRRRPAQALREARRVARPGGLIGAAFISRQAPIFDVSAQLRVNDESIYRELSTLTECGDNAFESGFTVAYLHTLDEIREDFAAAGFDPPTLFGIEGPLLSLLASRLVDDRPEYLEAALRAARPADGHPELVPASAHLLAVTHVPA